MGTRIAAVLFDAVGTLISPRRPVGETYTRVAAERGVALAGAPLEDAFRSVFPAMPPMAFPDAAPEARDELERHWWRDLVKKTFEHAVPNLRIEDFDALFGALFTAFGSGDAWVLRPGVRSGLERLRGAHRRVALLSNFDHRLHRVLAELELAHHFEFVLLPGEVGAAKPDRRIFAAALERLGLPGSAVAHVGDDERDDLEGARRAGIHGVDVRELATLDDLETTLRRIERQGEG